MLKHGILGLLNYGDMTGYEIMEVFRDSLKYFWTAQTSQIYRELQTLKKQGWVTDITVPQTGKPDKNLFSITDSGKEELRRFLSEENIGFDTKSPLLMKTFFLGELSPKDNIAFFEKIRESGEAFLADIQKPQENVALYQNQIPDPEKTLYWKMTLEYGIMYMNMLREWSNKCIAELEVLRDEHSCD